MRSGLYAVICAVGLVSACSDSDTEPTLTIDPAGTNGVVEIHGTTAFSAVLKNSSEPVTWSVADGGTLSAMTGLHVSYAPPAGSQPATLTATAGTLTASIQISSSPMQLDAGTIPGLHGTVTVQYDAQQIPHIKCAMAVDCIAVQGYVHAQDRFFPMDFLRHVARGRLAELIGPLGLSQDVTLRTMFTTRQGHRIEDDLVAALDNEGDTTSKDLITAYAAGVNAYLDHLRSGGGSLPAEYAQLPFALTANDIEPWTPQDTLAMARLQQFQLSETITQESGFGQFAKVYASGALADAAKMNAWIRAASPMSERAHTLSATASQSSAAPPPSMKAAATKLRQWKGSLAELATRFGKLRDALALPNAEVGSNNWVISADKSATGVAMVANDPHLALQYPPLFHLSVMTSTNPADNLDLAGGAFPGIPGALVGRGAHVGWGVTVVGYDVSDIYLEKLDVASTGCSPTVPCVTFKGNPVPLVVAPQVFKVRTAAGLVAAPTSGAGSVPGAVLVVPHHGPIIQLDTVNLSAASARWTGQEGTTHDLRGIFGLNTATNVDAAIEALKDFSTGAQNFVLADDQGHIAYDPHALVPIRQFGDATHVPWFPMPGDDGVAEWGAKGAGAPDCTVPDAAHTPGCFLPDEALPHGKDPAKGYYFTANADPLGVSDDNNPLAHQPYLSFNWDDSSGFRATRIEQLIEASLADHGKITVDDMMRIQSDHVSRPGAAFVPVLDQIIAAAPTGSVPVEAASALAVLDTWKTAGYDCPTGLVGTDPARSPADTNAAALQGSAGCFLFHVVLRTLATNVFADDLAVANQSVNGLYAIKAMLYLLTEVAPANTAAQSFCNNVDSKGVVTATHTCAEQVVIALATAYKTLTAQLGGKDHWTWGRVHTMQPVSLLQLVTNGFEPGPYARPGGAFTVDVGSPSLSASGLAFNFVSSGNVRHISVMSPTGAMTKMQLPGPERDGPTGIPGPDLLGQWVQNQYFDFLLGSAIDNAAVSTQSFRAP